MRQHQKNATAVAKFLETSPHITKVLFPGLPSHPQHELVKRQAKGFSGMVTFYVKGDITNVKKFFSGLKVFAVLLLLLLLLMIFCCLFKVVLLAESLGGYESLVDHP